MTYSINQIHKFYDDKNVFIGNYFRNMKDIKFEASDCATIQDAAVACVKISQSYQLPVILSFHGTKINIPFSQKNMVSARNIVSNYFNKLQK